MQIICSQDSPRVLLILSKDPEEQVLKQIRQPLALCPKLTVVVRSDPATALLYQPSAILSLGPQMLEFFHAAGAAPKNRKITGLRKQVLKYLGTPLLFSYNVGVGGIDHGQFIDLLTDVGLAARLAERGTITPEFGDYQYRPDLAQLIAQARQRISQGEIIDQAFDTETLGTDRFHPNGYFVSLQFSHQPKTATVVPFPDRKTCHQWLHDLKNQEDLSWLFTCPKIRTCAANGKYDFEWLYEHSGIECTNFVFDTTLVGSLLDENRSNALDVHAKIYVPRLSGYSDEFDQRANKARMDLEYQKNPEAFLKYAGGDTDATLEVKHAQRQILLEDSALAGFYINVLHPAARAFEQIERHGVVIDRPAFDALEKKLLVSINESIERAKKILGGTLVAKHYDSTKPGGINLQKPALIKDFMFSPAGINLKPRMTTEKTNEPATGIEHLELFAEVPEAKEFVQCMREFSSANKVLTTYVRGFLEHLRADGRFHPSFFLHRGNKDEGEGGTITGRLSAKEPSFQTIPTFHKWAKEIKKCYPAPPGYVVLAVDYSQGELRVIACIANETTMIQTYLEDKDLHALTSGRVKGYTYEEMMALKVSDPEKFDNLRQLGKAGNFGLIYGMQPPGFQDYARDSFGVMLPMIECEETHSTFFSTYPRLIDYHKEYKRYAHKHLQVVSPLGRVRHLPLINSQIQSVRSKAERQAINSPVQSTLSDMLLWALAILNQQGILAFAPCFGTIHDAAYFYVPEDQAERAVKMILEVMENLPFERVHWSPQLKFKADAKWGPNMGTLEKVKL